MREYQSVVLRLTTRARDDEELVTDLLNERARMGWDLVKMTALAPDRLIIVFSRDAVGTS
ncbi:MAG TPA: hypothetical protein VGA22_13290 [Gemmatimonadales bacterium]|jgi:hypothetical protein